MSSTITLVINVFFSILETKPFVGNLFEALRNKNYLPAAPPALDNVEKVSFFQKNLFVSNYFYRDIKGLNLSDKFV